MKEYLTYEEYGAVGDGKHDDFPAICKTHEKANELNLPVVGKSGAIYYMGPENITANIQTSTTWTGVTFLTIDRNLEKCDALLFVVTSKEPSFPIELKSVHKNQKNIGLTFQNEAYVFVKDESTRQFIRFGVNQNQGSPKRDSFLVSPDGIIKTDLAWDFDEITEAKATIVPKETLVIEGGLFKRIANLGAWDEETKSFVNRYQYHCRGIQVKRSNTVIKNVEFTVEDEGEIGAPYAGDLIVSDCAHVVIDSCKLSAHKLYWAKLQTGNSPMGTYGMSVNHSCDVKMLNLTQQTDIYDSSRWGIMGTNYCKDLYMENCKLSRFDAHCGVTNCTILNCEMGWQNLHEIGFGHLRVENTKVRGRTFIEFRYDYGCFWNGDCVIRNCTFTPTALGASVIGAGNSGTHDFGYPTMMPHTITIENLTIDTTFLPDDKQVTILPNYDEKRGDEVRPFPYEPVKELILKNVKTSKGNDVDIYHCAPILYSNLKVVK